MPLLVLQNYLQEMLELISFPETFKHKDKAKGETVDLRIKKKKKASRCVGGASLCRHMFGAGATALELHSCFLDSQQLCFFFFCFSMCVCVCVFSRFRFKGSREMWEAVGSRFSELWGPIVIRTGPCFFPIERFLKLKELQNWAVRGFSSRTAWSGPSFKTLVIVAEKLKE